MGEKGVETGLKWAPFTCLCIPKWSGVDFGKTRPKTAAGEWARGWAEAPAGLRQAHVHGQGTPVRVPPGSRLPLAPSRTSPPEAMGAVVRWAYAPAPGGPLERDAGRGRAVTERPRRLGDAWGLRGGGVAGAGADCVPGQAQPRPALADALTGPVGSGVGG